MFRRGAWTTPRKAKSGPGRAALGFLMQLGPAGAVDEVFNILLAPTKRS